MNQVSFSTKKNVKNVSFCSDSVCPNYDGKHIYLICLPNHTSIYLGQI